MDERLNGSDTASLQPKPRGKGVPFVKGDPRINRSGRKPSFDQFRTQAQAIAEESITLKDGRTMSVAEAVLRSWALSKDWRAKEAFIHFAFGKVPDKIEATGLENKTVLSLHFDHENGVTRG